MWYRTEPTNRRKKQQDVQLSAHITIVYSIKQNLYSPLSTSTNYCRLGERRPLVEISQAGCDVSSSNRGMNYLKIDAKQPEGQHMYFQ